MTAPRETLTLTLSLTWIKAVSLIVGMLIASAGIGWPLLLTCFEIRDAMHDVVSLKHDLVSHRGDHDALDADRSKVIREFEGRVRAVEVLVQEALR